MPLKTLPFSPARQAGDFLFISGQIARTADGGDVKESVAAETHQVMENIGRLLEDHGYAYDDLSGLWTPSSAGTYLTQLRWRIAMETSVRVDMSMRA